MACLEAVIRLGPSLPNPAMERHFGNIDSSKSCLLNVYLREDNIEADSGLSRPLPRRSYVIQSDLGAMHSFKDGGDVKHVS